MDVQGFLPVPVSPDNQSLLNLVFQFFLDDQGHRATRTLSVMEMRRNGPSASHLQTISTRSKILCHRTKERKNCKMILVSFPRGLKFLRGLQESETADLSLRTTAGMAVHVFSLCNQKVRLAFSSLPHILILSPFLSSSPSTHPRL